MKKLLCSLFVAMTLIMMCSFSAKGPGDGKTTCEVYGHSDYTVTVTHRVITPSDSGGVLTYQLELNKKNETGNSIYIVVQLRNASGDVIESKTANIGGKGKSASGWFDTKGAKKEVYYVTINSASCE